MNGVARGRVAHGRGPLKIGAESRARWIYRPTGWAIYFPQTANAFKFSPGVIGIHSKYRRIDQHLFNVSQIKTTRFVPLDDRLRRWPQTRSLQNKTSHGVGHFALYLEVFALPSLRISSLARACNSNSSQLTQFTVRLGVERRTESGNVQMVRTSSDKNMTDQLTYPVQPGAFASWRTSLLYRPLGVNVPCRTERNVAAAAGFQNRAIVDVFEESLICYESKNAFLEDCILAMVIMWKPP
ncbi:hypothetical protein EVAR_53220_1 [Eumeta japonica]|uniref:Uncharacterized protein n=1 Tax=Eumeta variegata TaxID=151549 RepID=A0A4C1XGH5_EUMVA|nr:hypothetical protein EVAR_53220_1 [Eumeta japonica]